jgi:chemotaxis protein methyltransferase CheR
MMYGISRVNLQEGKHDLVKSRLSKRLRALGLGSFKEYLAYLEGDPSGQELSAMVDALTTNKTSFFREAQHFDLLKERLLPGLVSSGKPIRIWSAGCSSGEESYTLAMLVREAVGNNPRQDVKILATDISTKVLAKAKQGVYDQACVEDVPSALLGRYFSTIGTGATRTYQAGDSLRSLVRFARLNLMDAWPMRGPFDIIFCRNVMIYFDRPTQQQLVRRYYDILAQDGHLFVGHSESLTGSALPFRYVQPAVYAK